MNDAVSPDGIDKAAQMLGRELDELERFTVKFLGRTPVIGKVPFAGAVSMIENVTSILLYRKGQFQVQMFAVPEGTVIPEHTHPNVDSIEIYAGGNIRFSHSGKYVYREDELFQTERGLSSRRGLAIRVKPNDLHGGTFGPGGGVFLSVQHWLNGVAPHCVAADYTGVTMGKDHLSKVVAGDATAKDELTAKDAAGLEH